MSDLESKAQQVETWLLGGNYQDVLIAKLRAIIERGSPDPMRVKQDIDRLEGVRVDEMRLDGSTGPMDVSAIEFVITAYHDGEQLELEVVAKEFVQGSLKIESMHIDRSIRF